MVILNQVHKMQFNLHNQFKSATLYGNNEKVVELSEEFFKNFPSIFEIQVKHSNISIKDERISWPESLKRLHFYGSSQLTLPIITDSNITNLEIVHWPSLKNISAIRFIHTLESLTLKNLENLRWVLCYSLFVLSWIFLN